MTAVKLRLWQRVGIVLLAVLFLVGLLLMSNLDDTFLSTYSAPTPVVAPVLIGLSVLLMASSAARKEFRSRFPTVWTRWFFWLVFVLLFAGLLHLSGRGWIAAASWLLARERATVALEVLSTERYETRRTLCLQRIHVKLGGSTTRLCADPLLAQGKIVAGQHLLADGLRSPLGFHVQALRLP